MKNFIIGFLLIGILANVCFVFGDDAYYYCNLAKQYQNSEDYNTAISYYDKALQIDPNYKSALFGSNVKHLFQYINAVSYLSNIFKQYPSPNNASSLFGSICNALS